MIINITIEIVNDEEDKVYHKQTPLRPKKTKHRKKYTPFGTRRVP